MFIKKRQKLEWREDVEGAEKFLGRHEPFFAVSFNNFKNRSFYRAVPFFFFGRIVKASSHRGFIPLLNVYCARVFGGKKHRGRRYFYDYRCFLSENKRIKTVSDAAQNNRQNN